MTIKTPRYLLVGAGLFAQNSYIPHLQQLDEKGRAKLMAIVEVYGNEHLRPLYSDLEFLFVPPFETTMPSSVHIELDLMIHRLRIDCVIISTDPLSHKAYGLWALKKGLNVIMDKPITTRKQACTSTSAASGIAEDFEELQDAYDELQSRKQTCFLVQCHRRYHPGFDFVIDKIREIQTLTGCPITSMSSSHCDGQWRMPKEVFLCYRLRKYF
jgi:predicted dehydrogenase